MKRLRALALVILSVALCLPARAAEKHPDGVNLSPSPHSSSAKKRNRQNPAAVALFKKAIQLSDIQSKNSTPFRLQASARIFNGQGQELDGLLVEFWAPGGKSRKETLLGGYVRATISLGKNRWQDSNFKYTPYPIRVAWSTLDFVDDLQEILRPAVEPPRPGETRRLFKKEMFGKPKFEKGEAAQCVETRGGGNTGTRYCFDRITGHLAEMTFLYNGMHFEFGGYQSFGDKSFPRVIRVLYHDQTEMAVLQITGLRAMENPHSSMFTPAPGMKEVSIAPGCKRITPAKRGREVQPVYPAAAEDKGISGRVILHTVIGEDGIPHALWVVRSPSPLLSDSAIEAVRQWRYTPPTCSATGAKFPVDTFITVVFNLGG